MGKREMYVCGGILFGYLIKGWLGIFLLVPLSLLIWKFDEHLVGWMEKKHVSDRATSRTSRRTSEGTRVMLLNIVGLFGAFARDLKFDPEEIADFTRDMVSTEFKVRSDDLEVVFPAFFEAASDNQKLREHAQTCYAEFFNEQDKLETLLRMLFKFAVSRGRIEVETEDELHRISTLFALPEQRYRNIRSQFSSALTFTTSDLNIFYALLECDRFTDDETLKENYERASQRLLENQSQSPNAAQMMLKIDEAYRSICKARGINA